MSATEPVEAVEPVELVEPPELLKPSYEIDSFDIYIHPPSRHVLGTK